MLTKYFFHQKKKRKKERPKMEYGEEELVACCGSTRFAQQLAKASPFSSLQQAIAAARDIWFNKVDVHGWLQAFSAHPQIGQSPSPSAHSTSAQEKFGFVFLICASGRSTDEILTELKKRYPNRPIVEFEIAAEEQMKITELRLAKLFSTKENVSSTGGDQFHQTASKKAEDRVSVIGGHLTATTVSDASVGKTSASPNPTRTRPPITTHVLDVSRGSPAAGIEVQLETWKGPQPRPLFGKSYTDGWAFLGSSTTNNDGRSGQLMSVVDDVNPGIYRISFNTGKYCPSGFFPYVSIVFEIKETQKREHFHVPLLLSPFSFSTYRGS
ncbi:hypothetical protein F8388_023745 [Cannabis sativa]|uniref:Transthyretin/hydroxyisourate hydrolase domain-containing protein n=1 Tax=Cannabis sativa TaxID=3483 RepID=A0A7J6H0J9_CANSA|nr:hypothetical protein F8388_023745 [Cannabis sativa]KAF4388693.1 hypothetical protein G4B88_018970 [Cannabis sativa]